MTFDYGRRKFAIIYRYRAVFTLLVCFLLTLSACEDRPTRDAIDQHAVETRHGLDSIMGETPAKHYNPLVVTDKVWTGNTALRMQRGLPLPPRYENPHGITLVSSEPMSLGDIANAITEQTGISVRISQTGSSSSSGGSSSNPAMPVAYEGPLSGLMERIVGYFGVNWHYDGSSISIARFETRVFAIEALPATSRATANVQQAQQGSAQSSASGGVTPQAQQSSLTQTTNVDISIKYWEELNQIITSMLGGVGTVVVSPSMGSVTVTTTPEIMHTVAEYIAQQNQRISRQVAINVEIYSVELDNGLDFDVAFTALIKKLTSLATSFSSAGAPTVVSGFTGVGTMNLAIVDPQTVGTYTDILTALSGIGDTTRVAKFPMLTLNNIPVIRRIGEEISYVSSASTTVTGTSGTAIESVQPGQIPEGFTVEITPRILDDGRILMDYSLDLIELVKIETFTSGGSSLELPDTTERVFTQQSVLKSGSTLIMGGAEEEDLQQNSQGVGSPYNYFLGGGISSGKTHTMIFFVITPQVVDTPHSEQE